MMTIYEALKWASSFLEEAGREHRIAEILLLHELNWNKTKLLTSLREELDEQIFQSFQEKVKRHAETGVPVQHLTGIEYFYGREFCVNNHVLIPRQETEELVQYAIEAVQSKEKPIIADIGTGSGVIAITIAKELEQCHVHAVDVSPEALTVAKENARIHQAPVTFYQGSFLEPLQKNEIVVDILVSNPPYIPYEDKETLSDTVINFDPALALFADHHGLAAYEEIVLQAKDVLAEDGWILFEIGHQQGEAVAQLLKHHFPQSDVKIIKDINKKDRIVWMKNYPQK